MRIMARILLGTLFLLQMAWAQAHVPEDEETAFLYVDAVHGKDSNPGTQAKPLKTLGKAMKLAIANNHNSVGTRVIVNPGTYRESINVGLQSGDTALPITFQAATPGTAIISGADVFTGWVLSHGQIYTHSWPNSWGFCQTEPKANNQMPIVKRREMIFVNGIPLTQVLASSQMLEGTFTVDETNQIVSIWPPNGTNMNTAVIEVATRSKIVELSKRTNMVFRDLIFEYGNACRPFGAVAVLSQANNILFDRDQFLWNNSAGLEVNGKANHLTVRYSVANHNGEVGFITSTVKNILWKNDLAAFNNWRGAQGTYYTHDAAGGDFFHLHNSSFQHFRTQSNQAPGIHWDTDAFKISADSLVASYNLMAGMEVEKSEGPIKISNASICHNGLAPTFNRDSGMNLRESEYVTVSGSTFVKNGDAEILVEGVPGGIFVTNWETGHGALLFDLYDTLSQDTIVSESGGYVMHNLMAGADWTLFSSTLDSDYNDWWNQSNEADFQLRVPEPGTVLTLPQWQLETAQDSHSVWARPSTGVGTACKVKPDVPDYWLVAQTEVYSFVVNRLPNTAIVALTTVDLGLTGTVNLSVDVSAVPGATATLNPSSISTSGNSTLQITAPPAHQHGTFPVTVFATSAGVTHTVTFALQW